MNTCESASKHGFAHFQACHVCGHPWCRMYIFSVRLNQYTIYTVKGQSRSQFKRIVGTLALGKGAPKARGWRRRRVGCGEGASPSPADYTGVWGSVASKALIVEKKNRNGLLVLDISIHHKW